MKNRIFNHILFIVLFFGLFGTRNIYAQWPQWRGINRDGISQEENLLKEWPASGPKRLWAVNSVGDGFASAAIYDNVLYTTGKIDSGEVVTALDTKGNIIWQKEYGRAHKGEWPESRCTPTFYKNNLYVVSGRGDIACMEGKTGNIVWKMQGNDKFGGIGDPTWGVCESPLVMEDRLIFTPCGKQTTVVALNSFNGETLWTSESISDTSNYASPVIIQEKDKKLIVTSTRNYTLVVDFQTGKIIWKEKSNYGIIPLVYNKQFYFLGGLNGKLFAFNDDFSYCTSVWNDSVAGNSTGGYVLIDNKLFGTTENPTIGLYCIDMNTGKVMFKNKSIKASSIIATKDHLYCCDNKNGKIYLLKIIGNDVEQKGYFRITLGTGPYLAHMSIGNGMLLVRHGKVLTAFDIKQP